MILHSDTDAHIDNSAYRLKMTSLNFAQRSAARIYYAVVASALLLTLCVGCGSGYDEKATLDAQIADKWIAGRQLHDAVEYFQAGGLFVDSGEPEDAPVDQPIVLPLVQKLKGELHLEVYVVLDKSNEAFALIAKLPEDEAEHQQIRDTLNEANEEFVGTIMHNWGNQWVSIDFLNAMESQFIKDAGVMEELLERQQ